MLLSFMLTQACLAQLEHQHLLYEREAAILVDKHDMDADGHRDYVMNRSWIKADEEGNYVQEFLWDQSYNIQEARFVDLNRDGLVDIIARQSGVSDLLTLINDGSGQLSIDLIKIGSFIDMDDYDMDGDLDLVIWSEEHGFELLEDSGQGLMSATAHALLFPFDSPVEGIKMYGQPFTIGDEAPDFIFAAEQFVYLAVNAGDFHFNYYKTNIEAVEINTCTIEDYNSDGIADLLISCHDDFNPSYGLARPKLCYGTTQTGSYDIDSEIFGNYSMAIGGNLHESNKDIVLGNIDIGECDVDLFVHVALGKVTGDSLELKYTYNPFDVNHFRILDGDIDERDMLSFTSIKYNESYGANFCDDCSLRKRLPVPRLYSNAQIKTYEAETGGLQTFAVCQSGRIARLDYQDNAASEPRFITGIEPSIGTSIFEDLDRDGMLELYFFKNDQWYYSEMLNEHEFGESTVIEIFGDDRDLKFRDVNGDGIKDVVRSDSEGIWINLSDEPGHGSEEEMFHEGWVYDFDFIDWDADGDLDLFYRSSDSFVYILEDLVVQEQIALSLDYGRTFCQDLDMDGRMDLVQVSGHDVLLHSNYATGVETVTVEWSPYYDTGYIGPRFIGVADILGHNGHVQAVWERAIVFYGGEMSLSHLEIADGLIVSSNNNGGPGILAQQPKTGNILLFNDQEADISAPLDNSVMPISQHLMVYPNPGPGVFKLEIHHAQVQDHSISVYDARGSLVLQQLVPAGTEAADLDISSFTDGVYLVTQSDGRQLIAETTIVKLRNTY